MRNENSNSFFYYLLILALFGFNSCSTINLKDPVKHAPLPKEPVQTIQYYSVRDTLPADTIRIGKFVFREDYNQSWEHNKLKFERFAKKNLSNVILIKKVGWGIKGHAFYMEGILYYGASSSKPKSQHQEQLAQQSCGLILLRDDKKGSISSAYTMDVSIDGRNFPGLNPKTCIRFFKNDCHQVQLSINKEEKVVELNRGLRYFRVYRVSNVGSNGFGLSYTFGASIYLIETHPDLGRILAQEFSEYAEQPKN